MKYNINKTSKFEYIEVGEGEPIVLLHGLFGALSNWSTVIEHFKQKRRVIIPILPMYSVSVLQANIKTLVRYFAKFVEYKGLENMSLIGNSLGGHIALMYTINNPKKVHNLVLIGSSGLFENAMGGSFPKRGNYDYIKERVQYTFYDPKVISEEFIQEIYQATNNLQKALRVVSIAKSAQRHNLADVLYKVQAPTLLIWGANDTITPPLVAYTFDRLIPNTTLKFFDKCCHVPMMEHPDKFNKELEKFFIQENYQ